MNIRPLRAERRTIRWPFGVPAIFAAALTWASCQPSPPPADTSSPQPDGAAPRGRVINVETWIVERGEFVEDIRITAVAAANRDATIAAEEAGRIREIYVEKGARVRAGAPILKIDDEVLAAQVDQARSVAELAADTWERRRRLFEEDSVGSEISYLDAKHAAEQASAMYRSLAARLERTTVRAPFAGVVDQRLVELGETVGPGQEVARLLDLNPAKIVAGVPERYAPDVEVGDEATVTFDVLGDSTFTATVRHVGSMVDARNRTFPVEMNIPNPSRSVKPEMVADVTLTRRRIESAVMVPQDALVRVEDGYIVYVVVGSGTGAVAEARSVALGPARRNVVVVDSGLTVGERLVVVGQRSVAAGDAVNVVGER